MKRKLTMLLFLTFFLLPLGVNAKEAYDIKEYYVDITVNEDNTLDIIENINVYFNEERHGIVREIPLINNVKRTDGTKNKIRAKVKNIDVDNNFSKYIENNNMNIKIGSANETVSGEVNYKISFTYDLGKEKNIGYDELYYTIMENKWDTLIENASFVIHMPKEYNRDNFGISTGLYGVEGTENVKVYFDGNDIYGELIGYLDNFETITVRIKLDDGYFVKENKFVFLNFIAIASAIGLAILAYLLWLKNGKDRDIVQTVEFYPPAGLNSAELGYAHKLKTKDEDVVSLLIYLANKGYISIEEENTKGKKYTIVKKKEYDGNNTIEQEFMSGLFSYKDRVTKSDLEDKFYLTVNSIMSIIKKKKYSYYEKESTTSRIVLVFTIFLTITLMFLKPMVENGETIGILASLFASLPFILFYGFVFGKIFTSENKVVGVIVSLFLLPSFIGPIIGIAGNSLFIDEELILPTVICVVSIALQILFFIIMGKRTENGAELEGKIRGFKEFLETAEKDKLEKLVYDDPSYYYNILPYTFVLGVSDKWIKKFESIALEKPDWYVSNSMTTFDFNTFNNSIKKTITSANKAMTSRPQPSGDYGGSSWSGGGGFSGGGSGGGGGHSW